MAQNNTENNTEKEKAKDQIPAIPPNDYTGTVADWLTELQIRGFWDGKDFYGDIMISTKDWRDILKVCETK
jgi:hypothetical protein